MLLRFSTRTGFIQTVFFNKKPVMSYGLGTECGKCEFFITNQHNQPSNTSNQAITTSS